MRTNKKERKENANKFYNSFINGNCKNAAIVVKRFDSNSNPNINRCQFLAVASPLAFMEKPLVIAESVIGITGCFIELLDNIKPGVQKMYYDDGFNDGVECGIEQTKIEAIENMIKLNIPKDKILECYSEAEYNLAVDNIND